MRQLKYFKTIVLRPALFAGMVLLTGGMRGPATAEPPATAHGGAVAWMSIEDAAGKLQQEKRPVLIDLYTTWCGWCKEMDRKTYSNKKVAEYIQDKFYPVKVDAETHQVINWQGRAYAFSPQYRSNEFALYLTHGQLEFPTTVIIPPGDVPQAIPGFLEPKDLELLVKYFGDGAYKTEGFEEYQKKFKASW